MSGVKSDQISAGTILTSQVMDCQMHVIGKAIRPLLAESVTYCVHANYTYCMVHASRVILFLFNQLRQFSMLYNYVS